MAGIGIGYPVRPALVICNAAIGHSAIAERPGNMQIKELVRHLAALPPRCNTLQAQRRVLGLSRAALARILEVDPSTVYRQELHNPMSMLWHYALRGIAAEAANKNMKSMRAHHKADLARKDELIGPGRLDACGYKFTAEKMRETVLSHYGAPGGSEPRCAHRKATPRPKSRVDKSNKRYVDAAVERAIARSERNKT